MARTYMHIGLVHLMQSCRELVSQSVAHVQDVLLRSTGRLQNISVTSSAFSHLFSEAKMTSCVAKGQSHQAVCTLRFYHCNKPTLVTTI